VKPELTERPRANMIIPLPFHSKHRSSSPGPLRALIGPEGVAGLLNAGDSFPFTSPN
jgi:hypothetical protein